MRTAAGARWFFPLALLVAALPAPALAAAAASSLPLDFFWDAPPECPSADAVRAQLERVVRVRRGRTPPHLTAWARVEQRGGRWFLHLRTDRDGTAGQRELEARACAPLVGAATLVLGLAFGEGVEVSADPLLVDPRGGTTAAEAEPAAAPDESPAPPAPQAAPAPSPPPPPPAPPSPPDLARPGVIASDGGRREHPLSLAALNWALVVDGRGAWGSPPGPAFGFGLGVDAGGRRWFGSLRFGLLPRADETAAPGITTRVTDVDGALSGCYRAGSWASPSLSACLGVQASALRVQSVGSTENSPKVAPWYAVLPALRLQAPLYRSISAVVQVAVATSLNRPTFTITGVGDVYRVPRLAPVASAGLSVRL